MRLEKMHDAELRRRAGSTRRTIFQIIWLAVSGLGAFLLVRYLFGENLLNAAMFYNDLSLPTAIPGWAIQAALIVIIVLLMQLFIFVGFMFGSPDGRRKSGVASVYSLNPDPLDDRH